MNTAASLRVALSRCCARSRPAAEAAMRQRCAAGGPSPACSTRQELKARLRRPMPLAATQRLLARCVGWHGFRSGSALFAVGPRRAAAAGGGDREKDEDEGREEEGGSDDEEDGIQRIMTVETPRGTKELLMQGTVIVEPKLSDMLAPADNSKISSAEYIASNVDLAACPPPKFPEFAFIGRSNVGKSSLINSLTSRKALAMVSKTPGKTQTINHFKVSSGNFGPWYLVDLPGYGFARAPGELTQKWAKFTQDYFLKRETLVSVMLLVDGSVPPQQIDLEVADWLGEHKIAFSVVFTKIDKRKKVRAGKRGKAIENVALFQEALSETWEEFPPMLLTSSSSGAGKSELLNHIAALRNHWKENKGAKRLGLAQPAGGSQGVRAGKAAAAAQKAGAAAAAAAAADGPMLSGGDGGAVAPVGIVTSSDPNDW